MAGSSVYPPAPINNLILTGFEEGGGEGRRKLVSGFILKFIICRLAGYGSRCI